MKKSRLITILVLAGMLGGGVAFYLYFSGFTRVVVKKFEGRLWELPARVYARPLALYPGLSLSLDAFVQELSLLAYHKVEKPQELKTAGEYFQDQTEVTFFCRPFNFGDKTSASFRLKVRFEAGRVAGLKNLDNGIAPEMVELDPVLVGSFYPISGEDRILTYLKEIPPLLPRTILCVEDRTFYTHHGVDPRSIFRALWVNLKNSQRTQGASTLTQQLARNFFLTNEKTWIRKVNELFMALVLELKYDKDEILEAYVNEVYLGQDGDRSIHGFGLASVFYFGTAARNLEIHETALLVGMLKGPSQYNPRKFPDRAINRRNTVLKMMHDQKIISERQMIKALAKPLGVIEDPVHGNSLFPDYLDLVKRQLLKEYREAELRSMGLRIFTALDPQVQQAAVNAVQGQLKKIAAHKGLPEENLEASVVVTSSGSNEIQAVVGGKHPFSMGYNRALDARRPIGSLVKPVVFLAALSRPQAYTLITRVDDGKITLKEPDGSSWSPRNFDRQYHGQVPLYLALVHSYNSATVRIGMDIGLEAIWNTLKHMGITEKPSLYPSSLLGTLEMSPVEVAQIYQTLASGGFYSPVRSIRAIYTAEGELLQRYPLTIEQHLDPGAVFLANKMLQAVVLDGTAKNLEKILPRELGVAGKTGTTNELKDSWFAGFTGSRVAVVWVGRDDNQSCNLTGASGAMQIFGDLMNQIPNQPLTLVAPESIEWAVIDAETGLRTDEACPGAMVIPFIKGSVPKEMSSCTRGIIPLQTQEKTLTPRALFDYLKDLFK